MTILIINNYRKKDNLNKVDQILSVLREMKKKNPMVGKFWKTSFTLLDELAN